MPPLSPAVQLLCAMLLLALGAEVLVRGAVAMARRFRLSSFFIGIAIVGFGTSTPELTASLRAAMEGKDDIALGNVVGSNLMNVALILGVTSLLRPIPMPGKVVRGEIWISLVASFVPFAALTGSGRLERWHGIVLLVGLVLFLVRGYRNGRRDARDARGVQHAEELLADPPVIAPDTQFGIAAACVFVVVGISMLVLGGGLLVDSAVVIARDMGVSELVIGLTIVAAGTSAPELVTSVVAALRGHSDVAVGNVLGSNVFNLLGVLGTTCVVTPQTVSDELLRRDVPAMILSMVAMLPMVRFGCVPRIGGVLLLLGYGGYVAWRIVG